MHQKIEEQVPLPPDFTAQASFSPKIIHPEIATQAPPSPKIHSKRRHQKYAEQIPLPPDFTEQMPFSPNFATQAPPSPKIHSERRRQKFEEQIPLPPDFTEQASFSPKFVIQAPPSPKIRPKTIRQKFEEQIPLPPDFTEQTLFSPKIRPKTIRPKFTAERIPLPPDFTEQALFSWNIDLNFAIQVPDSIEKVLGKIVDAEILQNVEALGSTRLKALDDAFPFLSLPIAHRIAMDKSLEAVPAPMRTEESPYPPCPLGGACREYSCVLIDGTRYFLKQASAIKCRADREIEAGNRIRNALLRIARNTTDLPETIKKFSYLSSLVAPFLLTINDKKYVASRMVENALTLEQLVRGFFPQTITLADRTRAVQHLMNGLNFLNDIGIIHNDLQWENILFDTQNKIYLIDFDKSTEKKVENLHQMKKIAIECLSLRSTEEIIEWSIEKIEELFKSYGFSEEQSIVIAKILKAPTVDEIFNLSQEF
jgi:tRNA A-37 threonylcarbamoyl transferase component Bud32